MLARAYRADVTWDSLDERWYQPDLGFYGGAVDTGVQVTATTIFRCAAVLAAVRFKAEAVAVCSPQTFLRLPNNRREAAPDHYSQQLLRNPNEGMTGYEWAHQMVVWLTTWGNSYNRIVAGRTSFAERLMPIHPTRCKPVEQKADGSLIYRYTPPGGGTPETLGSDQILHYRGFSLDGIQGEQTYQLIRNIVAIAQAAEKHIAAFLKKGTRLSGMITSEKTMTDTVQKRAESSWAETFGGPENTGRIAFLPAPLKFTPIMGDHQKAQLMELQYHQVEQALMSIGVPGVVVGYQGDKASTYASADAFFEKGGIKHCILPTVTNMEQRDEKALLLRGDPHYIKRNIDVLQRANTKDRFAALVQAAGGPFMTRNEVRTIEDLNPDDDPAMDKVLEPGNMAATGEKPDPAPPPFGGPRRPPPPPAEDEGDDEEAAARAERHRLFVEDAAARVVGRELAAIQGKPGQKGAAARYAKDPSAWRAWAEDYYGRHVMVVATTLHVEEDSARNYCEAQLRALLAGGLAVVQAWEKEAVPRLAALAMEA
jgi:HK97 family phage portal protein